MKSKIFFSTEQKERTSKLRELYEGKNSKIETRAVWINARFCKQQYFSKSLKWTRIFPENIELLVIDDAPQFFNYGPFNDIIKSGYLPIYRGKFKPVKIVDLPEIIISTNYQPTNIDSKFFELYEFPDITNPVT